MKLISDTSDIERNCATFCKALAAKNPNALELLRNGRVFVVVRTPSQIFFVPSRFAGYKNNSISRHYNWRDESILDGKQTNRVITQALFKSGGSLGPVKNYFAAKDKKYDRKYVRLLRDFDLSPTRRSRRFWASGVIELDSGLIHSEKPEEAVDGGRKRRGRIGAGPGESGERSGGEWQARSSHIYERLRQHLTAAGWHERDCSPWDADLFIEKPGWGFALFEIKPSFSRHNVIEAVGELICYRSAQQSRVLSVIAAEGISELSRDFELVLRKLEIETLDLSTADWKAKIDALLLARSRASILAEMDRIAAMTPEGVEQTDSTVLIREARDR